jgi:peptidoglycan/xylan/chitin deacetylase (PgdA/CDA1 family)
MRNAQESVTDPLLNSRPMNRREFTRALGAGVFSSVLTPSIVHATAPPAVAITMDDFAPLAADERTAEARTRSILAALRAHSIKAGLFVVGKNVESALGQRLLKLWDDEGHLIGNHTYSHRDYTTTEFADYTADVLRCELLIKDRSRFRRLFRFPYLKEGKTADTRDRMRSWLANRGYKNGAVTIDASDWYIDERMLNKLSTTPSADTRPYRDYYLQHILNRSIHYDGLATRVAGRGVSHTLLVHHNMLNSLYLGDILEQYKRRGWRLIDAEQAFDDPVFNELPKVLPAGESLALALALQSGKTRRERYPAEDGDYEAPKMDRLGL